MTNREILEYLEQYAMGLDGLPMPQWRGGDRVVWEQVVPDREGLMLVRCIVYEPQDTGDYVWLLEFDDGCTCYPLRYGWGCESVSQCVLRGAAWLEERALWELLPRGYRAPGAPRCWEGGAA